MHQTPALAPDPCADVTLLPRHGGLAEAHRWIAGLPYPAAILDHASTILAVNRAWKTVADRHHAPLETCGIGIDYLSVCDHAASDLDQEAGQFGEGLRRVLLGQAHRFELTLGGPLPSRSRVVRLDRLPGAAVVVTHEPLR